MSSQQTHGGRENPDIAHETSDISLRGIVWFVAVLTAIVLTVDLAMWGLFRVLNRMEVKNDPIVSPLAPPAGQPLGPPGLQTTPWRDLKQFRAEQSAFIHGYGWVDEKAGVARIPIEKAKELLLKRGLPVGPELGDALEGTHVAATGESNGGRNIPAGQPDKSSPAAPHAAAPAVPTVPTKPGGGGHD